MTGGVEIIDFTLALQNAIYSQMTTKGKATRDLSGKSGLTTEQFVEAVKERLENKTSSLHSPNLD